MSIDRYRRYEPIDGKWYITRELGKGAFGSVFKVERRDFGNARAAMKIITVPQSSAEVESFRQEHYELDDQSVTEYFYGCVENVIKEFQLMGMIKGHSNIVSLEDYNVVAHEDGIGWDIFIRMELLTPMNVYFSQNQITVNDVVKLGIDICKALEVCEKYNIIHRDIKPGNIFVSDTGEFKLGDFGIARTLERASGELSQKGTFTYMAPEVFTGKSYDSRVDIYSLGIVLYKMLNNNLEPFRTNNTHSDMQDAFARRMSGEAVPAPVNADAYLAGVVLKACAFNAEERYKTPTEFRLALESVLNGGSNWYDNSQNSFVSEEDTVVISSCAEKKKKSNGIKKIAVVSCVAVILAIVSVFMFMKTGSDNHEGDTIVYQTGANMTDEEKALTKEIVESRIEPLGKAVKLKTGENIEVLLGDKEVLGENYRERRYNFNMLISKGDLRIADRRTTNLSSFGKEAIESAELEFEPKEKFQTFFDDKMNDVERELVDESEGENVYYIHVKLNSNAAMYYKEMKERLEQNPYSYGAVVTNVTSEDKAIMDYDEVGYTIDITDDGSEFYILPEYFESELSSTILYNMIISDNLPDMVTAVLNNKTDWEDDESIFGKYQIHNTKGKLAGINIFLHDFENKYEEDETTEKFNAFVETIKNRMDALETEYIIGYNGIDNQDIMLKFSPDKVGAQIINMVINNRNISISSTFKTLAVDKQWISIYSVEPVIDEDGDVCLKVEISATKDELLTASAGDENFYLTVNGYTVARANINEITDGVIMFRDFLIFNEKEATDDETHVLNMISEIFEEKWVAAPSIEDTIIAYCEDGENWKLANDIPWRYSAFNYRDKLISKIVSEYGHKVTKPTTTNTSLNVILNIEENENFAENFVEEVKKVYTACGFDSGEYHSVMFVVNGETEENSSNRARFFVSRVYDWPSMKIEANFKGPDYEEYADEINTICQSDEFFTMRNFGMY